MIGIRVDANKYIASGHLMRCLSIADAIILHEDLVFLTSDQFAVEMIRCRGYEVVLLREDWKNKEKELDQIIEEIKSKSIRLLLIDSYQVTFTYLNSIRNVTKVAYIDDLNRFKYPVDIVINYSIYADEFEYSKEIECLRGTRYAPLRKQFDISKHVLEQSKRNRCVNRQILITSGATDPFCVSEKIVEAILAEPCLEEYRVVLIRGSFCKDHIYRFKDLSNRFIERENVENMAELMLASSMAVSAGGSTLYELCACCVPTVIFIYADNMRGNAKGFSDRGVMHYAGDVREEKDIIQVIIDKLILIHKNREEREEMIRKMNDLRCGKGAAYLAEKLTNV